MQDAVFPVMAALALASMAAYALVGRRRDSDAERKGARFLLGLGDFLVHWLMWVLGPLERVLVRRRVGPDALNVAGLIFGALSGALVASGRLGAGGWAIAAGGLCDVLDGRLARALQADSPYGKFIDSTLDRFVEVFIFLGFVWYLRGFTWGPMTAATALAGSLLVSYTRARGEALGVSCKEGLMQRAERLVLIMLVCWLDPLVIARWSWRPGSLVFAALAVIAAGTLITAVHRTVWISVRLRRPAERPLVL